MKDFLKSNIKEKIASVLLAIIFWLYVTNVTNPFETRTIYNVPVRVENESFLEDNGYKLKNTYRNTVDITIRGRRDSLQEITTNDFDVYVDYTQIDSVYDTKLFITEPLSKKKGVAVVSYYPTSIDIQLDKSKGATFPVELKSNITMKPGYVLIGTTMSPESIPFYLESSVIDTIGSIKADLEIKDLDRDMTKEVQCIVYNKDGKEISALSKDLKVTVKLEVAKEVPVSLVTKGRLASDYVETLRVIEPSTALITGPWEILANISSIKTDEVDIDQLTENLSATVPLIVPEGVKLYNTADSVKVNINVEKLVYRDVEVPADKISILNAVNDGSLTYEISTQTHVLKFRGRQADINEIRLESLRPSVDVAGLSEGTHKLRLNLSVSPQIKLLQQVYVDVKITKTKTEEPQAENT